ncbi:MAG: glycogen-binding domain-containing protein [Treponema sp.]|nr:glycogen-binding domain-containing protein [Treponema sp.]
MEDTYDYDSLVSGITGYSTPYTRGNSVIFTAKPDARYIGIAFDFEDFKQIHSFSSRKLHDADGKVTSSFFFYILNLPKNLTSLNYRLIIDGLWTTDPLNQSTVYNPSTGISLSHLDIDRQIIPETESRDNGLVHFVYRGKTGQHIRLGGTFTNWDSWIYELTEVKPGVYQIDLPLPPGTYYYAFYNGITSMVDTANPHRGYTSDGKKASIITVE